MTLTAGSVYRHFKGGKYIVVGYVRNATNGADSSPMVLYISEDQLGKTDKIFCCRSVDEFLSPVDKNKYPDANQLWRFEKLDTVCLPIFNSTEEL